jgi:hypothetical protein
VLLCTGHELVGRRIETLWRLNSAGDEVESGGRTVWLKADITAFNAIEDTHRCEYDMDGDVEDLNLVVVDRMWRLIK